MQLSQGAQILFQILGGEPGINGLDPNPVSRCHGPCCFHTSRLSRRIASASNKPSGGYDAAPGFSMWHAPGPRHIAAVVVHLPSSAKRAESEVFLVPCGWEDNRHSASKPVSRPDIVLVFRPPKFKVHRDHILESFFCLGLLVPRHKAVESNSGESLAGFGIELRKGCQCRFPSTTSRGRSWTYCFVQRPHCVVVLAQLQGCPEPKTPDRYLMFSRKCHPLGTRLDVRIGVVL